MDFKAMRQEVYDTTMMLCDNGLIRLAAGNVSMHDGEGHVAITPTGIRYDKLRMQDIAIVSLDGEMVDGENQPSSETALHTTLFRKLPEIRGVVHTHSVYAIAFSTVGRELPVMCVEIMSVGGPVPVAPWSSPGASNTGNITVDVFKAHPGLKAVMLRNHGLVAVGSTLNNAYENATNFETGAQIYKTALDLGEPVALTDEQIEETHRVYGVSRKQA